MSLRFDYHMNVAGIEKHLHELKEQAFDPFNIVTVGEANGVTADNTYFGLPKRPNTIKAVFST